MAIDTPPTPFWRRLWVAVSAEPNLVLPDSIPDKRTRYRVGRLGPGAGVVAT